MDRTILRVVFVAAAWVATVCLTVLCLGAWTVAHAQDAVTTATDVQAGTLEPTECVTTNLPANVWTLVLYDNAGNPCLTHATQLTGDCNSETWNWTVDGHIVFAAPPGYLRTRVRVQVWSGGGGGACYGGTADPIYCDNPTYKMLKQDETYEYNTDPSDPYPVDSSGAELAAPFSVLGYLLGAYFETPDDANYQGIWIFAMPIARPAICKSVSYHDWAAN